MSSITLMALEMQCLCNDVLKEGRETLMTFLWSESVQILLQTVTKLITMPPLVPLVLKTEVLRWTLSIFIVG